MPSTDRLKLPLYTDEETPDISTSGHYNESMRLVDAEAAKLEAQDTSIKADLDTEVARATTAEQANASAITAEVTRATAAEQANASAITAEVSRATAAEKKNAADITAEVTRATAAEKKNAADITAEVTRATAAEQAEATTRTEADTALGGRIDNAEAEISANSADLTGIKGLTYGTDHVTFLENENGSYTSPALEEIAEQIANAGGGMVVVDCDVLGSNPTMTKEDFDRLREAWPNCAIRQTSGHNVQGIYLPTNAGYQSGQSAPNRMEFHCAATGSTQTSPTNITLANQIVVRYNIPKPTVIVSNGVLPWVGVANRPFTTIGDGLSVSSDGTLSLASGDTPHLVAEINPTTATDAEKSTFSKTIWDATGGTMGGAHRLVLKSSMSTPGGSVDGFRSVDVTEMYPITDPTRLTLKIVADTSLTRFAATVYKTDDNGTLSYGAVFENVSVAPLSTEQKLSVYSF